MTSEATGAEPTLKGDESSAVALREKMPSAHEPAIHAASTATSASTSAHDPRRHCSSGAYSYTGGDKAMVMMEMIA
eukprot:CAMPEP_0171249944 /NCGR_PEP_ID=MMETSP0790-20130122/49831_1 /TAXON_ID=2925 /ORGANISM="Alexandrium catenella, Strain OF101" /LENGTH=75 /DNA_ID=CAMNT_0011717519 /DNA_START=40 /DNA_END=265 /DNA_ORIENTATION=-